MLRPRECGAARTATSERTCVGASRGGHSLRPLLLKGETTGSTVAVVGLVPAADELALVRDGVLTPPAPPPFAAASTARISSGCGASGSGAGTGLLRIRARASGAWDDAEGAAEY